MLAITSCILIWGMIRTGFCAIYLDERFDGPCLWEDHTGSTFSFSAQGGVGHIWEQSGSIGYHYISKVVSLLGVRSPHLEIDYRAEAVIYQYRRGSVHFADPHTGERLSYIVLCNGEGGDSGWRHGIFDLTQIVGNRSSIEIRIVLPDSWTDHKAQHFWFDNIIIWGMPHVSGIPDIQFESGDAGAPMDLDQFVTDTSTGKANIIWSVTGNSKVRVSIDDSTHLARFDSEPGWTGVEYVTLTATSPDGRTGSQAVKVTVRPRTPRSFPALTTTYLQDDLSSANTWDDHTRPDHGFSVSGGVGHIYEDAGQGGDAYVSRVINVHGARSLRVELDYRANSDAYKYTNAFIEFVNPHLCQSLGRVKITCGELVDTGWRHATFDISSIVGDLSVVEIRLLVLDGWVANHHQRFWFDNVQVWGEPHVAGIPDVQFDRKATSQPIKLDDFVTDGDKSGLTWSLYGSEHIVLEVSPQTRIAYFQGKQGWYGQETVAILATDSGGRCGYDLVTVTINPLDVPVVLDSSPRVSNLDVDGIIVPPSEQPKTFTWTEGTYHVITVPKPMITAGSTRYVFTKWSDGSTKTSVGLLGTEGLVLKAQFDTQYFLDASTEPLGIATFAEKAWHTSGSEVSLSVPNLGRYRFLHWILDGEVIPADTLSVTMDRPHTAKACYEQVIFEVNVSSDPVVSDVVVDGQRFPASSQPVVYDWTRNQTHWVWVADTIVEKGQVRYTFREWSDGLADVNRSLNPRADMSLKALFDTHYYLSLSTQPDGLASIEGDGWYIKGTTRRIDPPQVKGYRLLGWTVDGGTVPGTTLTVTMDRPHVAVARYELIVYKVTVCSQPRVGVITVDGQSVPSAVQPASYRWLPEQAHTVSAEETVGGGLTRYVFRAWEDGLKKATRTVTPTADTSLLALYRTEHHLSVEASPGGMVVVGGEGWYEHGALAYLSAPQVRDFEFQDWLVDGDGVVSGTRCLQLVMDRPRQVTARYVRVVPRVFLPSNLLVERVYSVSWDSISGASLYQLQEDIGPSFSSPRLVYEGAGVSASCIHTHPGTYYYRVRASRDGSWGNWSEPVEATILPSAFSKGARELVIVAGLLSVLVAGFYFGARLVKVARRVPSAQHDHPWLRMCGVIGAVLVGLVVFWVFMAPLTQFSRSMGWREARILKGQSETVSVAKFGDFEISHEDLGLLGGCVVVDSVVHGEQIMIGSLPFCYYDGVIRGNVLVFEWMDSDVDMVYVRYKVMKNEEFAEYRKAVSS